MRWRSTGWCGSDTTARAVNGIHKSIEAFRNGRLSLDRLSWELKSRIALLEGVADDAWVEELRAFRNQVEYVNAFWIDSGRSHLTEDERREVEEALAELQAMLLRY